MYGRAAASNGTQHRQERKPDPFITDHYATLRTTSLRSEVYYILFFSTIQRAPSDPSNGIPPPTLKVKKKKKKYMCSASQRIKVFLFLFSSILLGCFTIFSCACDGNAMIVRVDGWLYHIIFLDSFFNRGCLSFHYFINFELKERKSSFTSAPFDRKSGETRVYIPTPG